MSGLIIALIIVVFLMHRHHQKRFRRRYYYRTGEGPCSYGGKMGEDIVNDAMRKIGDHFGMYPTTIYYWLRKNGVTFRPRQGWTS